MAEPFNLDHVAQYFDIEVDIRLRSLGFFKDGEREIGGVLLVRRYRSEGLPFFVEFCAELTDPGGVMITAGKSDHSRGTPIRKLLGRRSTLVSGGTLDSEFLDQKFNEDFQLLAQNLSQLRSILEKR